MIANEELTPGIRYLTISLRSLLLSVFRVLNPLR